MAHTALDAAFVRHRRRIGKGVMEKLGIDSQWRSELFLIETCAKSVVPA
jgi:hypothetical protein